MKRFLVFLPTLLLFSVCFFLLQSPAFAANTCSSQNIQVTLSPNPLIATSDNNPVTITVNSNDLAEGHTYYIAFEAGQNFFDLRSDNDIQYNGGQMVFTRNFPQGAALDYNIALRRQRPGVQSDEELCALTGEDKLVIYGSEPKENNCQLTVPAQTDINSNIPVTATGLNPNTNYTVAWSAVLSAHSVTTQSDSNGALSATLKPITKTGRRTITVYPALGSGTGCSTTIEVFETMPETALGPTPTSGPKDCVINGSPGIITALGCIPTDTVPFINLLLSRAVPIAAGFAFILILSGAFTIITSAGNPDSLQKGKEIITSAITGLLVIIFSVFLLKLIGFDVLNLSDFTNTSQTNTNKIESKK